MIKLPGMFVLVGATVALAAVPPLSREQLLEQSRLIVTGTVATVSSEVQLREDGFADRIFRITLRVQTVEKGDPGAAGATIVAATWRPERRPPGWVGPQGQNLIPADGDSVRCYLRESGTGELVLLAPNGIEPLNVATAPCERR